jgi:hypothetical protein
MAQRDGILEQCQPARGHCRLGCGAGGAQEARRGRGRAGRFDIAGAHERKVRASPGDNRLPQGLQPAVSQDCERERGIGERNGPIEAAGQLETKLGSFAAGNKFDDDAEAVDLKVGPSF